MKHFILAVYSLVLVPSTFAQDDASELAVPDPDVVMICTSMSSQVEKIRCLQFILNKTFEPRSVRVCAGSMIAPAAKMECLQAIARPGTCPTYGSLTAQLTLVNSAIDLDQSAIARGLVEGLKSQIATCEPSLE